MTDKFAAIEPSKVDVLAGVLAACLVVGGGFVLLNWSGSTPRPLSGVVQSVGPISVSRVHGATQEAASVRLPNGSLVTAYVASGGPISPGDTVRILEQPRLVGWPSYEVVSKESSQ
jgi:hypothetical protein